MPTYDYKREDGTVFEHRQGINDEPLTTCPTTGQPVKRIISGGAGVVYKGEGWYIKEYGTGSTSASNESSNGTSNGESGSNEKKTSTDK
ncbi:MAG: zinc ribbon domain-containing protein [Balneolaceae bacterium]